MTKLPGGPPKPITKAEREARKAFRQLDAEKAMTEHEIAQKAFVPIGSGSRLSGWRGRPPGRRFRQRKPRPRTRRVKNPSPFAA
jgi:hypothetical protein